MVHKSGSMRGAGAQVPVSTRPQYLPEPNEWLHEFCWYGSDQKNPRRKVSYTFRFIKLRDIRDQTYFDVRDVRTADDALLTV